MNLHEYMLPMEKLEISDFPLEASVDLYSRAIHFLVNHWSHLTNKPASIYQIGQIGAPGISDLDFILVFEDASPVDLKHFLPERFPAWIQDLFTHSPFFTTLKSWPNLHGWHPTFNITHLWGRELPLPTILPEHEKGLALGMLIDYLTIKIPADLLTYGLQRPLRLRTLLCLLNSVKYIFYLSEKSGIPACSDAGKFSDDIQNLRSHWHDHDNAENLEILLRLWDQTIHLSLEQIDLVDNFLIKEFPDLSTTNQGSPDSMFWFYSPEEDESRLELAIQNQKSHGIIPWPSPPSFLCVFSHYAEVEPILFRYFSKQGLKLSKSFPETAWSAGLRFHAHAMVINRLECKKMNLPSLKYVSLGCLPLSIPTRARQYLFRLLRGERSIQDLMRLVTCRMMFH